MKVNGFSSEIGFFKIVKLKGEDVAVKLVDKPYPDNYLLLGGWKGEADFTAESLAQLQRLENFVPLSNIDEYCPFAILEKDGQLILSRVEKWMILIISQLFC